MGMKDNGIPGFRGIQVGKDRHKVISTAIGMVMMELPSSDAMPMMYVIHRVNQVLTGFFREDPLTSQESKLVAQPWIETIVELSIAFDNRRHQDTDNSVVGWFLGPT